MTRIEPISGAELARSWSDAPTFLAHAQGCGCCGDTGVGVDVASLEADILDYLALKYADAGAHTLADFVSLRRNHPDRSFAQWLIALDACDLPAPDLARLKTDLATTLHSVR